jgi:copper chaperone CopZ
MPTTTFTLPTMTTQADAEAVMFELQDLPCISNAGVDLAHHRAWAEHTRMIDPGDIAAALAEAGHEAVDMETSD